MSTNYINQNTSAEGHDNKQAATTADKSAPAAKPVPPDQFAKSVVKPGWDLGTLDELYGYNYPGRSVKQEPLPELFPPFPEFKPAVEPINIPPVQTNLESFPIDLNGHKIPIDRIDLNKQIDELAKRIVDMDNNVSKAVKDIKRTIPTPEAPPPPRYEIILTHDDLRELDRMLTEIEAGLKPIPKAVGHSTFPFNNSSHISAPPPVAEQTIPLYSERDTIMAKKEGWVREPDGTQKCYKNGKLHNDTGPAEIRANGTKLYYRNGKLHRDGNLPAMIGAGGTEKYAVNGKYHRLGGKPAITWSKSDFREEWWENGEIKRATKKNGTQEWYAPGSTEREEAIYHRTDGPAVVYANGKEEFWLNGQQYYSRHEWEQALNTINNMREEALDRELIDEDPIEVYEDVEPSTKKVVKTQTEKKKMEKPSFTEMMKKNAAEAGYRVAATQSTAIVNNAILALMRKQGASEGALAGIAGFLETEFGRALISVALGTGLNYVPHFGEDPRVQKLAEEMRIGGMATAGNAVIGEAMAHVLPALTQVLQNLPAVENSTTSNVRVEESKTLAETIEEEEASAEEEEVIVPKTMKA